MAYILTGPDEQYDLLIDKMIEAQKTCPYLERTEPIDGDDGKICLQNMAHCEARRHCPLGKW